VHAPAQAFEIGGRDQEPGGQGGAGGRERIEETDLDVGMRGVPGQGRVAADRVEIVEQDAHPDAVLGRPADVSGELARGRIALDDVVLEVE
jgi:hypothetical protein